MLQSIHRSALSRTRRRPVACLLCQWHAFATTPASRLSEKPPAAKREEAAAAGGTPPQDARQQQQQATGPLADAPRSYGKRTEEFTPRPLARPIGMPHPPREGENTGIDQRTLQERRDDFVDYDKHLVRREQLKQKMAKPYFREWTNMQFHKGKTFIAPARPFRADLSLYFPNLYGRTLLKEDRGRARDTTPTLRGRASVVAVFSSAWAEKQVGSFVSEGENPALAEILRRSGGKAQMVQINVEENSLKAWLIRLFMGSLRKRVGRLNWDKYFIIRRGISDEIRESIGLLNSKVGHTYLVDHNCKIRWAGSGPAEPEERDGLVKGVRRLLDEMSKEAAQPSTKLHGKQ